MLSSITGVVLSVQVAYDYGTAEKLSPSREKLKGVLERLLEYKRSGKPIIQSQMYFKALLNSCYYNSPWECKPWLTINIDPKGESYYLVICSMSTPVIKGFGRSI